MALTTEERIELWAKFQRHQSSERILMSITKSELRAAVDAIDDWVDSVQSSFNSAIPQPARSALTMKQKLKIFMEILNVRWAVE